MKKSLAIGSLALFIILILIGASAPSSDSQNQEEIDTTSSSTESDISNETEPVVINDDLKQDSMQYEIQQERNDIRYDSATTFFIKIDAVDYSTDSFKDNIKSLVRDLIQAKGSKISIEVLDNQEAIDLFYTQYGENSLGRVRTDDENKLLAKHHIASYDGELSANIYSNTLSYFPSASSDDDVIGELVSTEEFNPD